jgi:hypothetical protein
LKNLYIRVARWLLLLFGGVLIGGGLVLHAQVAVAHVMREEVESTFILWRGIGRLTFSLQSEVTRTACAIDEIPKSVLAEADRTAWVLVVIGAVLAALTLLIRSRPK